MQTMTMNPRSKRHASRGLPAVLFALLLISPVAALSACGPRSELAAGSPLSNAYRSPEALAEAALAALAARDEEALQALLITREEYETLVWPLLPDSRGSSTFDFVWGISNPRNRKARREVLEDYGGLPLELVSVDPGDDIEAYDGLVLYKEAVLTVRNTEDGREGRMRFMDVLIEMGGGWKFMNFREG